jgi:hypothetical protein
MFSDEELARTYDPVGYTDAVEQVTDYNNVQRYVGQHPDAGRVRVGNAFDLPPERVRGWMNDKRPDTVRGIGTARQHGWLDLDPDTNQGRRFAELAVGVIASGSIQQGNWQVAWAPETAEADHRLWRALDEHGVSPRRRHADDRDRPTELLPGVDGSVLARCLHTAGAPVGDTNERSLTALPDWLLDADEQTRQRCAVLVLLERAMTQQSKDTVQFRGQNRSLAYRRSLARLFRSLVDGEVSVGENVVLSADAVRELDFGRCGKLRPK